MPKGGNPSDRAVSHVSVKVNSAPWPDRVPARKLLDDRPHDPVAQVDHGRDGGILEAADLCSKAQAQAGGAVVVLRIAEGIVRQRVRNRLADQSGELGSAKPSALIIYDKSTCVNRSLLKFFRFPATVASRRCRIYCEAGVPARQSLALRGPPLASLVG